MGKAEILHSLDSLKTVGWWKQLLSLLCRSRLLSHGNDAIATSEEVALQDDACSPQHLHPLLLIDFRTITRVDLLAQPF